MSGSVSTTPRKENIMGTMPIVPLLIKLSVPMMLSMLVQALYNVVDSVFVSRVSEAALTAVSLAFPMQNIMIAVGVGTGVGVNALLSRSLGEKNYKAANRAAENGLLLAFCSMVVFMLIGIFVVPFFFKSQSTDPEIIRYGEQYLSVCMILCQGIMFSTMNEKLLNSTGKTNLSMICQMTGAVTNIVLDPIFIFGFCGEALSGTRGAAAATVIGQYVGASLGFYFVFKKNPEVTIKIKNLVRPHWETIRRIYSVAVPSIAMQCVGSFMTFMLNQILMAFSATAVAVFGVYFKLQSFVFMPIFGMNNGMVPIVSYNYGARRPDRLKETIRDSMIAAEGVMFLGFLAFELLPKQLLGIFNASDEMLAIGVTALRAIGLNFLVAGISVISISVLQAFGRGTWSLTISVVRQLVVLLPVAWLLSLLGNVNYVWYAFPIAEVFGLTLSLFFLLRVMRSVVKPMEEEFAAARAAQN